MSSLASSVSHKSKSCDKYMIGENIMQNRNKIRQDARAIIKAANRAAQEAAMALAYLDAHDTDLDVLAAANVQSAKDDFKLISER